MVHINNRLFEEDDIQSGDEMDFHLQKGGTSAPVDCGPVEEHPSLGVFEASSIIFRSIDWTATNVSLSSGLEARCTSWEKGAELLKGLRFADKIKLQTAIKQYHIERHYEFRVVELEPKLWMIKCKNRESGCNWMLRAIKRYDYFEITRYISPHACISAMLSQDHSGLDSNFIVNKIRDVVKEMPIISIVGIGAIIKTRFNYTANYRKLWEAKQKAMALIYGDWDKSYDLLPKWLRAVQKFNPDSWVKFISLLPVILHWLYLIVLFGHLHHQLKASNTIDRLSVSMLHLCTKNIERS